MPPKRDNEGSEETRALRALSPGTQISHYRIIEKIGEGGMGIVYAATDTKLERKVALKFLPPHLTRDPEARERFIREARAVSALDHPNICVVHEIEETLDGQTFIVMACYDGETLKQRIGRGPLETGDAINLALQIASGLAKAHSEGIVHRDIKPANLMITSEGILKIMDFGLAKLAGQTDLTQVGSTMGTVAYMSPEQARGSEVDARSDIWALGVVLYEMLTSGLPFRGESYQVMLNSVLNDQPKSLAIARPELPFDLQAVVARALDKDPEQRYKDAAGIIRALENVKCALAVGSESAASPPTSSVAVLPLTNLSADPEQEYFCDGLTEEIINALAHVDSLRVVARTSSFTFKDKHVDIREIGRKLGVGAIVEGSVRKAGNRLRITAQLVNVGDGYHLWSEKYDRDAEDVFAIQDDVALAIVDNLKVKLLGGERHQVVKRYTRSPEAHSLYLKGRYFLNQRTGATLRKSIECFREAIEKDPMYAKAFAGLADAYLNLTDLYCMAPMEAYPKAKEAALRACEIDNSLSEAHTSLAFLQMKLDLDWEGAEKSFRRAIDLNPGYAQAHHWYGLWHMFHKQFDRAISKIMTALDLDPLSLIINRDIGQIYLFSGRYDAAIDALERTLDIDPHFPGTRGFIGLAYYCKSMYQRAMEEIDTERAASAGWIQMLETLKALTYAGMGNLAKARGILEEMLKQAEEVYVSPYFIGSVLLAIGEDDKAFEWYWKAYEDRDSNIPYMTLDPTPASFRSDSRYLEIVSKLGLRK